MTQAVPQNADPFAPVPQSIGVVSPMARHLIGRTIIVRPVSVDETSTRTVNGVTSPNPTAYADIIVVDGGPIEYGDSLDAGKPRPVSHRVDTPCLFKGWMDSHQYIVEPIRKLLAAGRPVTVGVIQRGTQGNHPFFLTETHLDVDNNPRPDGAERRARAINLYNAFQGGQWTSPQAVEINPQAAAAATQAWGQPAVLPANAVQFTPATAAQVAATGTAPNPLAALAASWGQPAPAAAPIRDLTVAVPGLEALWSQASEAQRREAWKLYDEQNMAPVAAATAPAVTPWG